MPIRPTLVALFLVIPLAGCVDNGQDTDTAAQLLDPQGVQPTGVVHEFDIYVRADYTQDIGGMGNHSWSYRFAFGEDDAGSIPAPEIRVRQGDTVRARLHTDTEHTIHWHGVLLPWGMDGVPAMTQEVGVGTYVYEFVANEAGTFWYHCHVKAPEHIDMGMFGAFIVEPADPDEDPAFDREATLFLHEYDLGSYAVTDAVFKTTDGDQSGADSVNTLPRNPADLAEAVGHNAAVASNEATYFGPGYAGQEGVSTRGYLPRYDTFMINAKSFPHTDPVEIESGETLRIRLVNAGQLTHAMHLHGHRFLVTHKDGAVLQSPYLADTIGLFPGERYDIYVQGNNPGHWDFHDHGGAWGIGGFAANRGVFPGGMATTLEYTDWEMPALTGPV